MGASSLVTPSPQTRAFASRERSKEAETQARVPLRSPWSSRRFPQSPGVLAAVQTNSWVPLLLGVGAALKSRPSRGPKAAETSGHQWGGYARPFLYCPEGTVGPRGLGTLTREEVRGTETVRRGISCRDPLAAQRLRAALPRPWGEGGR